MSLRTENKPVEGVPPLLELKELHVSYPTASGLLPAVRGVSLTVQAGESVGLAGESGCGKSTLASTILRLQPKGARVEGKVLVNGQDTQTAELLAQQVLPALRPGDGVQPARRTVTGAQPGPSRPSNS